MTFIDEQGLLILAEWATDGFVVPGGNEQALTVHTHAREHPMYGTTATGERLVSNGHLGVDLIRVPAGGGFAPHTHPGDHLLICVAGLGTISFGGRIYPTRAGQVYMVEGEEPHAVGAITDHAILAVGAPHRAVDAADRMTLTAYDAVAADLGEVTCLMCDVSAPVARLADYGCAHAPPQPGPGKPLVVGLAPAYDDQPAAFVGTQSGRNLAQLFGCDEAELLDRVDTVNLSPVPVDRWQNVKRDEWQRMARDRVYELLPNRVVVCAGRTVAHAFGIEGHGADWGTASLVHTGGPNALAVTVPHPSGLSRSWNDGGVRDRCTRALRLALTFAKVDPPSGEWCQRDADALNAVLAAAA